MTIHDFHTQLDSQVLQRGQAYMMEGAVLELVQESESDWLARVAGSNEYQVAVTLDGERILQSQCNCPYDQGPYCKHEVAVLLVIRKDLEREAYAKESGLPQKLFRRPSFRAQVKQVGEQAGKEELLDFIVEAGKNDRGFREAFLIRFGEYLGEDKASLLRRMVRQVIRQAEGSKGYLAVKDTETVADELNEMLARYEGGSEYGLLRQIVAEEVREAMKSAEDFEGYLAGLADG